MNSLTLHHMGVAVQNLPEATTSLGRLLGYQVCSGPFDDPIQKVAVLFLTQGEGDAMIELAAPLGPDSPIRNTLKKGGGVYHICYQTPDIRASIEHFTAEGSLLISGPVSAVAFAMREVAWLMTEQGLLVELLQA